MGNGGGISGIGIQQPTQIGTTEGMHGIMGNRNVKQGTTQMPRLDKIKGTTPPKGNIFIRPFQSKETRISRTSRSLDAKAGKLLQSLKRDVDGNLNMQKLLNNMKTMRLHTDRLSELFEKTVDHTDTLQLALAGRFSATSNRDLLDSFSIFMSKDMTKLRNILEQEVLTNPGNVDAKHALEDLGVMEATLMMEISTRVARSRAGENETVPSLQERLFATSSNPSKDVLKDFYKKHGLSEEDQTRKLSDRHLETLINAGGRSSALRKGLQARGQQRLMNKGVHEVSLKEVGDTVRKSDLTINFTLKNLLGIGRKTSPIKDDAGLRNMFQWGRKPEENPGLMKRDLTERGFFPSLEKEALDPDSRPIYGAMNVGRGAQGGAKEYGGTFFVTKPSVKQRCTFTRDDTFNVTMCSVNPKNLQTFRDGLDGLIGKLSQSARDKFNANGGELKQKLLDYFSEQSGNQPFTVYQLSTKIEIYLGGGKGSGVSEVSHDDFDTIANHVENIFRDNQATQEQVVGFDDVESLLPFLGEERLDRLMTAIANPKQKEVRLSNYIEAQIHGPVNFNEDIESLQVSQMDIEDAAKLLLKDRHKGEGGYVPTQEEINNAMQEVYLKLEGFCEKNGIEFNIYDDSMIDENIMGAEELVDTFKKAHHDVLDMTRTFMTDDSTDEGSFKSIMSETANALGFTGTLSEERIGQLTEVIARAAQQDVDGDHSKLTKANLTKVSPDLVKNAIKQQMAETREANQNKLFTFLDTKSGGPQSLMGVLSSIKETKGFAHDLNPANLRSLGSNIFKAFGKVNTGNEAMDMQAITDFAQKEVDTYITTKQTLLATLNSLEFGEPAHKTQWQSFVLGSSTLREPQMLKTLHAQSREAHDMMASFLTEDGFQQQKFLEALQKFTSRTGDAQQSVHDELGRDLARDDRYLFIDRTLSLAVTTMDLSEDDKQKLYDFLTGEDVGTMRAYVMKEGGDVLLAGNMSDTLLLLARNIGRELNIERNTVGKIMDDQLQKGEKVETPSSTLRQALDNTVKIQTLKAFPTPNKTVNMKFSDFKENELPSILDIYMGHEKTFDRGMIHGRMHVSRALIYTKALASIFKEKGAQPDTHILYRSIALHDSGRESNGADVYEGKSAKKLTDYLQQKGIDSKAYLRAGGLCIACGSNIQTLEEGIMNSSDTLEIMRTKGRDKFDPNHLWFMNNPVRDANGTLIAPDTQLRDKLLDEVAEFIKMTDLPPLKEQSDLDGAIQRNADSEELMTLNEKLKVARENQVQEQWDIPSNTFFANMEKVLVDNPEKFPTLHKYYTMHE